MSITLEQATSAGVFEYELVYPKVMDFENAQRLHTWPECMPVPEEVVLIGTRKYSKTAVQLAKELNTTPRQISKMRAGKIQEMKTLDWYNENGMKSGV